MYSRRVSSFRSTSFLFFFYLQGARVSSFGFTSFLFFYIYRERAILQTWSTVNRNPFRGVHFICPAQQTDTYFGCAPHRKKNYVILQQPLNSLGMYTFVITYCCLYFKYCTCIWYVHHDAAILSPHHQFVNP